MTRPTIQFLSNYRGESDFAVVAGPLAGKRIRYRYLRPEWYAKDYADYGARAYRCDPDTFRRDVLGSVGLVCCSGAVVPQSIVDEVNLLLADWRGNNPDLAAGPARAGVYVQGIGWTPAANIILRYADHLERLTSVAGAEKWLSHPGREAPDAVWEEDDDCKCLREFDCIVVGGRLRLAEVGELRDHSDEHEAMAPAC